MAGYTYEKTHSAVSSTNTVLLLLLLLVFLVHLNWTRKNSTTVLIQLESTWRCGDAFVSHSPSLRFCRFRSMRCVCYWTHNRKTLFMQRATQPSASCRTENAMNILCASEWKRVFSCCFFWLCDVGNGSLSCTTRLVCVCDVRCTFTCLHLHSANHRNKRENTYTVVDVSNTYEIDMRSTEHWRTSAFGWMCVRAAKTQNVTWVWMARSFSLYGCCCCFSLKNPLNGPSSIGVQYPHIRNAHQCCVWIEEKLYVWLGLAVMLIFSQQQVYTIVRYAPLPCQHMASKTYTNTTTPVKYVRSLSLNFGIPTSKQSINSYAERIAIDDLHIMSTEQFLVNFWLQCKRFSCILCISFCLYGCECVWESLSEWVSACTAVLRMWCVSIRKPIFSFSFLCLCVFVWRR